MFYICHVPLIKANECLRHCTCRQVGERERPPTDRYGRWRNVEAIVTSEMSGYVDEEEPPLMCVRGNDGSVN